MPSQTSVAAGYVKIVVSELGSIFNQLALTNICVLFQHVLLVVFRAIRRDQF